MNESQKNSNDIIIKGIVMLFGKLRSFLGLSNQEAKYKNPIILLVVIVPRLKILKFSKLKENTKA